jgi:DNA repair ATPase RecN
MNREDIIRTAQEAGLHIATDVKWMPIIDLEYAEKFAALVASAERERIKQANAQEIERINSHIKKLENAVKAEREACAKVCDDLDKMRGYSYADKCAAAIRARGQA